MTKTDKSAPLLKRLRSPWHHADCRAAADEIERAWAARDAAVADLEAYAESEVRRAVAAERERCAAKLTQAEYLIGAFERGADAADYSRDIAEFRA